MNGRTTPALLFCLGMFFLAGCQRELPNENRIPSGDMQDQVFVAMNGDCHFRMLVVDAAHIKFDENKMTAFFQVTGSFTLGSCSSGIDPATQKVAFELGDFDKALPAGSLTWTGDAWVYKGEQGTFQHIIITPTGDRSYQFLVNARQAKMGETYEEGPRGVGVGLEFWGGPFGENGSETTIRMTVTPSGEWAYKR